MRPAFRYDLNSYIFKLANKHSNPRLIRDGTGSLSSTFDLITYNPLGLNYRPPHQMLDKLYNYD